MERGVGSTDSCTLGGYDTSCRSLLSLKDFDTVLISSVSLMLVEGGRGIDVGCGDSFPHSNHVCKMHLYIFPLAHFKCCGARFTSQGTYSFVVVSKVYLDL